MLVFYFVIIYNIYDYIGVLIMKSLYKVLSKYKFVIMSLILVFLIIMLIITIIHFGGSKKTQDETTKPVIPDRSESRTNGELSGDSTILAVCRENNKIVFMSILDFRVYSENIILTVLSPDTRYNGRSYNETLSYGGIKTLVDAVENVRQCRIDRYVVMDREGFCDIADIMGKVTLNVTENFSYMSSDKSYNVEAGENDMESAMLYTYIKINSEKTDGLRRVSELLCHIINIYLSETDPDDAQKLFGELCNCVNTDISVFDYYSCSSDIEYLLTHNVKCSVFDVN